MLPKRPNRNTTYKRHNPLQMQGVANESGREDLNLRPLDPQSSVLNQAELRPGHYSVVRIDQDKPNPARVNHHVPPSWRISSSWHFRRLRLSGPKLSIHALT